ncbi:transglutaminase-like cysteine peptidase [Rhizobium sp. AQ_MP]|uniref:transglutaminase-like cysteine peptidase n=1 Tax=Rhizobium sp. AQ_MP TaxID=2761536 RepID=UPI00163A92ED|nr:transglutaminase-like cysteine peptidase [Rhizobium sp. AQ_MP]MBC2771678.1 transglutaminase-like cysteine peptidase [Rhizobium sp. AQ_MP]
MQKNKKNIIAISALAGAMLASSGATASPLLPQTLSSYSTVAQTLVLGISPVMASLGKSFIGNFEQQWQQAAHLLARPTPTTSVAFVPGAKDLSTGAVSRPQNSLSPNAARTQTDDVFGSVAIPFKKLGALRKAAPTFAEIAKGTALKCGKVNCFDTDAVVQRTAAGSGMSSVRDKLNLVNHEVNSRIKYRKDIDSHGRLDQWSSPSQTLASGYGDCEDYALLKMAVLEAQGFSLQDMTLVILYDKKRHFYHAVLSVEVQGTHYILDNMRNQVLADSRLPDYQPLFSISNGRGFLHGTRTKGKATAMKSFDSIAPGEGGEL